MSLLKKLFFFFNLDKPAPQNEVETDELVGLWENDLDDGSGLHAIWGWSFRFEENGLGTYCHWSGQKLDSEITFCWIRVNENSIKAKYEEDETWTIIKYSLQIIDAPYSGKLIKLTDNNYVSTDLGKEGFWDCFGAVFMRR